MTKLDVVSFESNARIPRPVLFPCSVKKIHPGGGVDSTLLKLIDTLFAAPEASHVESFEEGESTCWHYMRMKELEMRNEVDFLGRAVCKRLVYDLCKWRFCVKL